jgi:hypothetical protein
MKRFLAVLIAAFFLALAISAYAQDPRPNPVNPGPQDSQMDQDSQSAPEYPAAPDDEALASLANSPRAQAAQPGVARVSLADGDVSTQHGDSGQWSAVTVNTPISQDDRVSVGEKSRAELELDFADVLRMSERSTARVVSLSRTQIQIQVGQGRVTYNMLKGGEAHPEIDTPNASIRPLDGEGEYRIVVNSDAETQVIVRRGSAEISTSQGTTRVERGQMITIAGTDSPQYKVAGAPVPDDWDGWNDSRNKSIRSADSWHKTNPYYTGTEDLDGHGVWSEVPDYGPVWTPSQAPGWAPYRTGRWVYQPYYGWTWVSYEPWGWAPYHYGRWFVYGGNWVWWPGPVAAYPAYYPIWSPAYVSFFGWGGGGFGVGFGFGFGFGRVGWLPIGPCDRFHPWWGGGRFGAAGIHSTGFAHGGWAPLQNGRVHQFSNLNEVERNDRVRSGISAMDGNKFGREAVGGRQGGVSSTSFRQASMMTGKLPVTPSHESFNSTNRAPGASSVRTASNSSQHFFSSANVRQNSAASAAANRNRVSGASSQTRTYNNQREINPPSSQRNPSSQSHGQNSYPNTRVQGGATTQNGQNGRGGWQHFSPPPSRNVPSAGPTQSARQYQSPASNSRGGYPSANNRPPLNMNKPIVQPRGGYPNGRGGYPGAARGPYGPAGGVYRGAPPSAAPHTAPRPSAPTNNSAPHGNSGGAPRSGASSPHGGHSR